MLTEPEIRLELLKLAYIHSRLAAEAVDRATEMEKYVKGDPVAGKDTLHLPPKKAGNPVR